MQQFLDVVFTVIDRQPDADRRLRQPFFRRGADLDRLTHAFGDDFGRLRTRPLEDADKFLAADAPQHILVAQRRLRALTDAMDHPVAHRMAVRVVDPLEMVDVEDRDRERGAIIARAGQRLFEERQRMAPVRQPGEHVGVRYALGRAAGGLQYARILDRLGHVLHRAEDADRAAVAPLLDRPVRFHMPDLAIGAPDPPLKFKRLAGPYRRFQGLAHRNPVLGDILLDAIVDIDRHSGLQPVNAIRLVRPGDRPADKIDAPMPDQCRGLGLQQPAITLFEPLRQPLAPDQQGRERQRREQQDEQIELQEQYPGLLHALDRRDRTISLPRQQRGDDRHDQHSRRRAKRAQSISCRHHRDARQEGGGKLRLRKGQYSDQPGGGQDRRRLGLHRRRRIGQRFRVDHAGEHHDRRGHDQHSEQHRRQPGKEKVGPLSSQPPREDGADEARRKGRDAKADNRTRHHE